MNLFRAAVAFAFSIVPASANADGDALIKFGFVGRWALVCEAPPDDDNAHLIYAAPVDGPPTEQMIMGEYNRTRPLSNVKQLAADKVEWTQRSDDKILTIVNLIEPKRLKTWSSTASDGAVYIRDGAYAYADGDGEAPWFHRCPAP